MKDLKIIGHRGAAGYALENSLEAFQLAIDIGCDRTELDVRLSKDGVPVISHDEDLARLFDKPYRIKDKTAVELKEIGLATLREAKELCENKINLQIELKEPGTPQAVVSVMNNLKNCVITSFKPDLLKEVRELDKKADLGLLFSEYKTELWELCKSLQLNRICPKSTIVTEDIVKKTHSLQLLVYAYHVNDLKQARILLEMGVDEIGTDFPKLFFPK